VASLALGVRPMHAGRHAEFRTIYARNGDPQQQKIAPR
jgi:hypothetical protein